MANSLEFRPHQGLMKCGEAIALRLGLLPLWDGDEGLRVVVSEALEDLGVPLKGIPLTPHRAAEAVGLVKKKRRARVRNA